MSQQQDAPRPSAFLESLIAFLMPFFIATAVDIDTARAEILETLNAYATRTRTEMLNAARIIAFGMATLDTLSESKSADLSPSMRLRYRGCANGLNRSTLQNEKALDQRLACDLPQPAEPASAPVNDLPDNAVQGAIDHARAGIDRYRDRLSNARPATQPDRNKQLWAGAMMDTLKQMGLPHGPVASG